jgi:hypothetical protein
MEAKIKSPIFIVGCPRSGTTLLQQMLDAHPDVAIAPETHFMQYFWEKQEQYGDLNEDANYRRLLTDIIDLPEFTEMGLSAEDFSEEAWNNERNYGAIFRLLLEQFAKTKKVKILGEKTPNHVLYITQLKQFFPDARFIHIVRDPRAVVNSYRSVPWSAGSIVGDARLWQYHVSAARRCPSQIKSSIFTLYYEQLVLAPEEHLRSLCRFLDLEFMPAMLTYYQKELQLVNVKREPWKAKSLKPVNQASLNRWQTELSGEMIADIEAIVWFQMRELGYKLQSKPKQLVLKIPLMAIKYYINQVKIKISSYMTKINAILQR